MSSHSSWYLQDDHTYPNDPTRGYFLEIDGKGGTSPVYSTTINDILPGSQISFSAYVANVGKASEFMTGRVVIYPCLRFEFADANGTTLATHSTGNIPCDASLPSPTDFIYSSQWHLHGLSFTVPSGVTTLRLTIYNDVMYNGSGNDFAIDDIEIRECAPPAPCPDTLIALTADTVICDYLLPFTWHGVLFDEPSTQSVIEQNLRGCDTIEYTLTLDTIHCERPCPEIVRLWIDTMVCDTLLPFTWHDLVFNEPDVQSIMVQSPRGCDSIEYVCTLDTIHCERPCPEIVTYSIDTLVCDTLLPFTWRGISFTKPDVQRVVEKSPRGCDSIEYVYTLDTVHCERFYPLIVNKYNWQLLCDNVLVAKLFPELTITGYQWFKNGALIPDATGDDYSEQNELQGDFQLRLELADGQFVYSYILTIAASVSNVPARVRVYNSRGELVVEQETTEAFTLQPLPAGIYLVRVEQGENVRIVKTMIAL